MAQKRKKLRAKRVRNKGGRPPGRKKGATIPKFFTFKLLTLEDLFGSSKSRKKKKR